MSFIYLQTKRSILFILFLLSICCTNQLLAQTPCGAGQKFETITPTGGGTFPNIGSLPSFNSVVVTKTDIVGTTTASGAANGASTWLGSSYIPTSNFIDDGGYTNYTINKGEETDVTYTFCNPVTDPYIFVGYLGIDEHSTIEVVGKPITKVAGSAGFLVSGSTISASAQDQNGYVKVPGTHTSLTLKMKASTLSIFYQLYTIGIGVCYTPPVPKVPVPFAACAAGSTLKNVNFDKTAAFAGGMVLDSAYTFAGTDGPFILRDNLDARIGSAYDAAGVIPAGAVAVPVKAEITTSAATALCGPFSANSNFVGQYQSTTVAKDGDGFSYTYKFNTPVKLKLENYGLLYSNGIITIEAKNGATPVNVSATLTSASTGIVTAMPGNPMGTLLQSTGSSWDAWPDGVVTEITFTYKSTTYNILGHQLLICSSPPPPPAPPCTGATTKLKTATHWNSSSQGYFTAAQPGTAQMASGNSITIVKNDVAAPIAASSTIGYASGGDTYTNAYSFPNAPGVGYPNYVDGGGFMNLYTYKNGVTELTYTFCKPVTDPYVFFGWAGISGGGKVKFDKPITIMDSEVGLDFVGVNEIGVSNPSKIYQNGYVKIPGSITSFKMTFTNGATWNQIFTLMVGECNMFTQKPANPFTCAAGSSETNVNFTNTAAIPANAAFASAYTSTGTKGPFRLISPTAGTDVNDATGAPVKATIITSAPNADLCGAFSADPAYAGISLLGNYQTTVVNKAGDGFSYTYKFTSPVKVKLRNITSNFGVVHNEVITFEAKNGAAPVNISATASGAGVNEGLVLAYNTTGVMITGTSGGSVWNAWTDAEVTEITFQYKSNNGDVWRQETHELIICSKPCEPQYPVGCAPANQRTAAFGFASTSANAATGAKGANTLTMTTTAGLPIKAASMRGASTMNECGDANKQFAVSSGGWALIGAKNGLASGEKITVTFAQPVKDPVILLWGIYSTTKVDVGGITSCLQPIRKWGTASTVNTSMTGTGVGYWQIPGTFTSLEFDVTTFYTDWFYFGIGEASCLPPVEDLTTPTPTALTCSDPGFSLKTYDANFDRIISAYKTVSGKTYNPVATETRPTVGYAVGPVMDVTVNDVTVDCSTNNNYYFGLYSYTSYPVGKLPASGGCSPGTAPFSSAGGGAVYAYSGVGTQGTFPWVTPGNMKWTFNEEVVNPIIKVKYLSWTKLSFKDCDNNTIPIATIPGTLKGGLTANGSSLFNNPVPTNIYANQVPNEWSDDGREGEGAVQLIGRFKEINIQVEKTAVWLDYWSMTLSEQVCTDAPAPTIACDAVIPSCPTASAGPTPPASSGNPTTVAATFTKTGFYGAVGSLTTGGKPIITTVVSTSEILSANTDRAPSTFNNAACYSVAPVGGGAVTIKDIGGSNTTTISFGRSIANPLIYIKDLTRLELDFGTTLDIDGNAVCCMKQISASNGFTTTGTKIADNNPTETGSPAAPLTPGCGLVQLVGTFSNIVIKSSRPSGTALFENWIMSIGGEAVCLPNSVIASLGAAPQDPANPNVPPAIIVVPAAPAAPGSPAAGAPVPVGVTKAIANIKPKDPANPAGNQIVTYRVNLNNSSATKINNLFITDMFDPKYVPGVVVAVIAPKITYPGGPLQQTNAAFNGTSNTDLLNMSINNMLDAYQSLTIEYGVEINPTLIPGGVRHNNNLVVGSTTMALKISNLNSADPNAPISVPFYPPASIQMPMDKEVTICNGAAPVEFAKYGQCQGGAKIMNNPACGAINWSFTWVEDKSKVYCGGTSGKIVTFRGIDACQNVYEYTTKFSTTDNCPPIFDMLPMDKTVICADANALASINMWLASAGGAWFGDTGSEKNTVTSSHDYKQTTCVPGVYTVKFTITDGCANSSAATAVLTVKATSTTTATPSVISNNNELIAKTIQCSAPMAFDKPNVTTNCPAGIKSLTYTDAKTNGTCANNYKMRRTWLATDECGTTYSIAQEISVVDNTAPVFNTKAASFTMTSAHFKLWKNIYFSKLLKATDGCSKTNMQAPTFTYSADKATVECKTIAKDECGNASQYTCIVNINNSKVITKVMSDDHNAEMEISLDELEQIAAIDESGEIKDAVLYPNPTADILRIIPAVGHGTIVNVKITNVDGRVMYNQKVVGQTEDIITIDVKGFHSGNYIIEMEHSNKKLYKMIQKIN